MVGQGYEVFNEWKHASHVKIGANLTKRRGKILYDAVNLTDEPFNGKYVLSFETMEEFGKLLIETGCSLQYIYAFTYSSVHSCPYLSSVQRFSLTSSMIPPLLHPPLPYPYSQQFGTVQ